MGVLKESRQIVSINGFAAWIVLNQRRDQAGYPSTTPKIGLSHHVHQIRDQLDAGVKRGEKLLNVYAQRCEPRPIRVYMTFDEFESIVFSGSNYEAGLAAIRFLTVAGYDF